MKLQRVFILCILLLSTANISGQIRTTINEIFHTKSDSLITTDSSYNKTEIENQVTQLQQSLEEAKLNEANVRMEFEQYKLNILASDSIKRQKQ